MSAASFDLKASKRLPGMFCSLNLATSCKSEPTNTNLPVEPYFLALSRSFGSNKTPSKTVLTTLTLMWLSFPSVRVKLKDRMPAFSTTASSRSSVRTLSPKVLTESWLDRSSCQTSIRVVGV